MLLAEVVAGLDVREIVGDGDPVVVDVTHDSRHVVAGSLFCCLPGAVAGRSKGPVSAPQIAERGDRMRCCGYPVSATGTSRAAP